MNRLIKSLVVAAGVALAGSAVAQSNPAETAGICAGTAYRLMEYGQMNNIQAMSAAGRERVVALNDRYGNQPGFDIARAQTIAQSRSVSIESTRRVFAQCTQAGF